MADPETTAADAQGADEILRASFKQRLLLSLVADIDQLSFRYRSERMSPEAFVVAVRDRVDAMYSLVRNARVASHLGDAELLLDGDVLRAASDRLTRLAGPSDLERLCARVLGSDDDAPAPDARPCDAKGSEKARSGLYSSTKSPGSISLRNGYDEALDARPGFEGEKPSQEVFPPQSRPDLPFSKPVELARQGFDVLDAMVPPDAGMPRPRYRAVMTGQIGALDWTALRCVCRALECDVTRVVTRAMDYQIARARRLARAFARKRPAPGAPGPCAPKEDGAQPPPAGERPCTPAAPSGAGACCLCGRHFAIAGTRGPWKHRTVRRVSSAPARVRALVGQRGITDKDAMLCRECRIALLEGVTS